MSTVAEIFAHTLKEIGVRYVFGVPSGNMIDYVEALRKEDGIDFILVGHEATAAFMAGVCGRLTGVPGVCFATFGPGATNLSTGVGGAQLDRFPLLAFTDEMPDNLRNRTVQMNIDHEQLFFPITKWTTRITQENIAEIILKAAGIATENTPGAVHIGIPAGIGRNPVEKVKAEVDYLRLEKKRWSPLVADQVTKIEKLLTKSKKPVLALGLSAVHAQVGEQLVSLAEKLQVPVVLTPMAKGLFPEEHSLYGGVLFHALSNHVANVYSQADLVIGIGYDPVEFNYEDWMPKVPLIHIDFKKADVETGQIPEVLNVVGTIDVALNELLQLMIPAKEWDLKFLEQNRKEIVKKLTPKPDSFGPLTVVDELRKALPDNGILTVDVGAHLHLVGQQWRTPHPEKLLMTNGWSSMGFAIPAALAAKLCNPDAPVVSLMGDGGFLMMVGELATAKRLNLNIVFVVIYDDSLSLISIKQTKKNFDSGYGTDLNVMEDEPTNNYFGVPAVRVTNSEEYKTALEKAFAADDPLVIEAVVSRGEYDELVLQPNK
ncbi:thiamine pyrophosphate-binding protein [Draconibacterium sp. IB214405]|uniref:thiamine pyrophosphate-binding protein n=1 Tax=Draconibacterium sp. IB214405 TaxID=3097352 RepID=UPI002A0FF72A|nr:thiamine pyrophosphate-binding protein [Draconibacterium sp. IB214405]MDX8341415.1 thiamine pyrophosphate-binding protein [Draconibacterium sp. IB214405]